MPQGEGAWPLAKPLSLTDVMGGDASSRPRRHPSASNRDVSFSYSICSGRTT
jgi:hypothetical protein